MIDLDDVKAHLSTFHDGDLPWDDETIRNVQRAEHAAQLTVVNVPSTGRTEALDQALLRRVAVNLEQTGGDPLVRVGGSDPEVRQLEAPHSNRVTAAEKAGTDEASTTPTDGGRTTKRRSTSKKTQSRKD